MELSDLKRIIGERFREARNEKGLTLQEVEEAIGYSVSRVSNYEQGLRLAGPEEAKMLGTLYGVPPSHLLMLDEESLLSPMEQELLKQFRACSPEAQQLLLLTSALYAQHRTAEKTK